jgi:hypothetical protein
MDRCSPIRKSGPELRLQTQCEKELRTSSKRLCDLPERQLQCTTAKDHCRRASLSSQMCQLPSIRKYVAPRHSHDILTNTGHLTWTSANGQIKQIGHGNVMVVSSSEDMLHFHTWLVLGVKNDKHTLGKARFWMY